MLIVLASFIATILLVWLCIIVESFVAKRSKCGSYNHFRSLSGGLVMCSYQLWSKLIFDMAKMFFFWFGVYIVDYTLVVTFWSDLWLVPYLLIAISLKDRDDGLDIFMRESFKRLKLTIYAVVILSFLVVVLISSWFGLTKTIDSFLLFLLSTATILISIWIFLGGLKRLIKKIKDRLKRFVDRPRLAHS